MNTRSICSSCSHENNCIYLKNASGNIFQCEEFELEPVKKAEALIAEQVDTCENNFTGLCKNCKEQGHCHLQNCNSVIWHCEEFHI